LQVQKAVKAVLLVFKRIKMLRRAFLLLFKRLQRNPDALKVLPGCVKSTYCQKYILIPLDTPSYLCL
jgi:hypothetical protein